MTLRHWFSACKKWRKLQLTLRVYTALTPYLTQAESARSASQFFMLYKTSENSTVNTQDFS